MYPLAGINRNCSILIVRGSDRETVLNTHCCDPPIDEILVYKIDGKGGWYIVYRYC